MRFETWYYRQYHRDRGTAGNTASPKVFCLQILCRTGTHSRRSDRRTLATNGLAVIPFRRFRCMPVKSAMTRWRTP